MLKRSNKMMVLDACTVEIIDSEAEPRLSKQKAKHGAENPRDGYQKQCLTQANGSE